MSKIKFPVVLLLCFAISFLPSCKNSDADDVRQIAEKYSRETEINLDHLYKLTNWLVPETEYENSSDDDMDNIAGSVGNYIVNGDRLYFKVSKDNLYTYVDLKTGKKFNLCPDPFCEHTLESGCKYINLSQLVFFTKLG